MKRKHISNIESLDTIRKEWEDIYASSAFRSPILSFQYIKFWYECFAGQDNVRVYRVTDDKEGNTVGFMPMVIVKIGGIALLKNLTNDHCFYGEALVRKGSEQIFRNNIITELLMEKEWDILHHKFNYSFSSVYPVLSSQIINKRKYYTKYNTQPTYTILFDATVEQYINKHLSHNLKSQLRRCKNKLHKNSTYKFKHYRGSTALELWPEFLRIEDSGWKGRNGTSILRTGSKYRRYYDGFINILSAMDNLHIYLLEVDNKNIACVFGYMVGDMFEYFKIGYDEQYHALSPSNLLFMHMLEDLVTQHKVKRVHLFPGDETGYKERFSNEKSTFSEITIYNNTITGRGIYLYDKLKKKIAKNPVLAKNVKRVLSLVNK